ncbi:hypothetical protein J2810_003693 [Chryseobacterium rhizosphaerae]|uniref:hypothetical protein n=1 Tax=Chryseobacterium rhizosphaerae TaxID=395937 RepID=UPI000647E335|nr:hypothetical protein [Chryseobacterium rhizosphaerae]MDR6547608.1 hypothetical protein [Chryseobacterium rhizosphaerae]
MINSNIYPLNLNKLIVFFLTILLIGCSKERFDKKKDIEISILKKEKIDNNTLIISLLLKNNSNKNYVIPNYLGYYLVHTMKGNKQYDATGKIKGKIISSEFSEKLNEKYLKLFYLYYSNTFYKNDYCNKLSYFNDSNDLVYSSSLLFLPRNSKRKITLAFNSTDFNRKTFFNENTRIALGLDLTSNFNVLDSLLKAEKIDYKVYDRNLILNDSLFIN